MSHCRPASASRVVPTLLALGLLGGGLSAADPVFSAATLGDGSVQPTLTIDWGENIGGFDPILAADLEIYDANTEPIAASASAITVTKAMITAATTARYTVLQLPVSTNQQQVLGAGQGRCRL